MAKQFPRIHSLSTIGIQHHFHTDYLFHHFRTDFSGDSGVGKSMIADMLQLIFAGSEFLSATEGTDERLARTMPAGRYGYVFINVEVDAHQYIVLGMFISTATINPDPFIIQSGYGKNAYTPLQNPISYKDILNGEIIEDIDTVSIRLDGRFNCQKMTQKAYHEYLMEYELLPIQITDKARLKNYARILRSFARGRGFKYDSESLKHFFFDDNKETEIYDDFQKRLDNIEADLDGHRRHKEILESVSAKEQDLINLKSLKQKKHESEIEFYKAKSVFYFRNIQNKEKEISDNQQKIRYAIVCIAKIRTDKLQKEITDTDLLFDEIHIHKETIKNAEDKLLEVNNAEKILKTKSDEILRECTQLPLFENSKKTDIIEHIEQLYNEIQTIEGWLEKYQTMEEVKNRFYFQQENSAKRDKIKNLENTINKEKLKDVFLYSDWVLSDNIENSYQQKIDELDDEIKKQQALSKFADTNNPYSLSSWALKNGKTLNKEQESVLMHFKDLTTQKPELFEEGAKYLPSPEELFYHLNFEKNEEDGFWIKLNGIYEYIAYIQTQFFNTSDINQLEKYFAENYEKSQSELERLEKEREQQLALKSLLNQVGNDTIKAYKEKTDIESFKSDKDLDKTKNEFESYCTHYFYAEEIKRWKAEIDKYLITTKQSALIREQINKDLNNIVTFLRQNGLQTESNSEKLRNVLLKLENEKTQKQKDAKHQLRWYSKIADTPNNIAAQNESNELAERKVAKQNIFKIQQELEKERLEFSEYLLKYENLSNEKLNIELNNYQNQYLNPNDEEMTLNKIIESYRLHYDDIVRKYVHSAGQIRFKDSEDFIALSKEILPEILTRKIINDEIDVLQQIRDYLTEITDKYTEFSDVKLNILKEIFTEVRDSSIEYLTEISEISNYFSRNDCQISQGVTLNIKHNYSDIYPIDWIDNFVNRLEEKATNTGLFASLGEKIGIEEMMKEAYSRCGGKARKIEIKHLLNPKSYFNIDFNMKKSDGTVNSGSTGQTYAAIALLCIARLSLIEKKASGGRKQAKGLRIMPIDETENIGSNFDMLEKIAQDYDYQLVVISRHPLDDDGEKGRYQYMLNGQIDGGKIGTFAIFNEGENAIEYVSPISNSL